MKKIDVSIVIVSYNHEKYIEEAIDSVLNQKVNFNYEIIFADDCSLDNTQKIIKEKTKNLKNIVYLFNDINKGNTYNSLNAYKNCKGKYIIALESDDYWTDNKKLQNQYDFLENNRDYIAVSDKRYIINKENKKLKSYPSWIRKDTDISLKHLLKGKYFSGIQTMFINFYKYKLINSKFEKLYLQDRMIGDLPLCFFLCSNGKVRVLNRDTAVYRTITSGNNENYNAKLKLIDISKNHIKILNRLYDLYNYDFSYNYAEHLMEGFIGSILAKDLKKYNEIIKLVPKKLKLKSKIKLIFVIPSFINKIFIKVLNK